MPNFHRFKPQSFQLSRSRNFITRHHRAITSGIWALIAVCVVVVGLQWWYGQQQLVRPWTSVNGVSLTNQTRAQVETIIHEEYGDGDLVVTVKDKRIKSSLAKTGVAPDTELLARQVTDYPSWQRFIPFTLLAHVGKQYEVGSIIDQTRFTQFAQATITPVCYQPAVNASVEVVKGQLKLLSAQPGASCPPESVAEHIRSARFTSEGVSVPLTPDPEKPAVTTEAARQVLIQAKQLVDRKLQVQVLDTVVTPDRRQIAGWLTFESDAKTGKVSVDVSKSKIKTYIKSLQKSIYVAPGQTVVKLVDGDEVGRVVGASGQGIAIKRGVDSIRNQLLSADGSVTLELSVLKPTLRYDRSYTKTEDGLRALVKSLAAKGDVAISVNHIGGRGWSASAHGNKVYTPASTYKLFAAYAALKQIESGAMKWNDRATGGQSVSDCFDTMIINSDNPCAEWFGESIGWKKITSMIHGAGISQATSLYTKQGFVATANDEALFLTKLQRGQLLSSSSTKRLLSVMKRQVYRSGIPAGVGLSVADKVGFLNGLLHDAGIVYAPSGTYSLVIMTKGSSWAHIADIARQINAHLR